MQVIRLQRVGKKNQPSFRVVLQEKSWAPQGKAQELLGFYDPINKERKFHEERITHWISKGAQPSPTVHNLLVDAGVIEGEKVQAWRPKVKKKGEEAPAAASAEKEPAGSAPEEGGEGTSEEATPTEEEPKTSDEPEGEKEKTSTEEPEAPVEEETKEKQKNEGGDSDESQEKESPTEEPEETDEGDDENGDKA